MNKKEALAKIEELKKYIEELEKPIYSIGDRFYTGDVWSDVTECYILAQVSFDEVCLIGMKSGCGLKDAVQVNDTDEITKEDFELITAGDAERWTKM